MLVSISSDMIVIGFSDVEIVVGDERGKRVLLSTLGAIETK